MLIEYERHTYPGDWVSVSHAFNYNFVTDLMEFFPEPYIIDYDGRRACTNEVRTFANREATPELAAYFSDWDTDHARQFFTDVSGVDCSAGRLRVELCQDGPGFYLDRHIDIPEKLITLQVYLGGGSDSWGTSLYDNDTGKLVHTNLFKHNTGWLTWAHGNVLHGVEKNMVDDTRRSVIINYVAGDWKDLDQLY